MGMKKSLRKMCISLVLSLVFSSLAFGFGPQDGFLNKKNGQRIYLDRHPERSDSYTFFLSEAGDPTRGRVLSTHVAVPMGSDLDPFQERYATYHALMAEAQIRLPSIPQILMIYHLRRSTPIYLNTFRAIEEGGGLISCPPLYFEKFLQAIEAQQN